MKRIIFISILSFLASQVKGQNCMTLFSYGASFETVQFFNQSEMSNAHYWWNFGDGTGSYYENPVHTYPENGHYLVTLFAKDTISNCSDYHELWLNVTKYSTDTCQPSIVDSVFTSNGTDYITVIENSPNCEGYDSYYDIGPSFNFPTAHWQNVGNWKSARFISRVKYSTSDTINGSIMKRQAYTTSPYNYSSGVNYGECSANFEYTVVSEDTTGQRVLFTAMNKSAISYEWEIIGFGMPIYSYADTVSKKYNFTYNNLWLVALTTEDANGCIDTLIQEILIHSDVSTTVGIMDVEVLSIPVQVYPNPFTETTSFQFDNPIFKKHKLTLLNPTGQVVKVYSNITSGQVTIDRENLANGIYFYKLQTDNGQTATGKLIVN